MDSAVKDKLSLRGAAKPPHFRFRDTVAIGDIVISVRQTRSGVSAPPKTRGGLRALGLRGPQSTNLQPDAATTWGMVAQCREYVHATRVRVTVGGLTEVEGGGVVTARTYELSPGVGKSIQIDSVPVAWVERGDVGDGVTWVADNNLRPAHLVKIAATALSISDSASEAELIFLSGDAETVPARSVGSADLEALAAVSWVVREQLEVLWQRNLVEPRSIEVSLVGSLPTVDAILKLARLTISPLVKVHLSDVETEVRKALR